MQHQDVYFIAAGFVFYFAQLFVFFRTHSRGTSGDIRDARVTSMQGSQGRVVFLFFRNKVFSRYGKLQGCGTISSPHKRARGQREK